MSKAQDIASILTEDGLDSPPPAGNSSDELFQRYDKHWDIVYNSYQELVALRKRQDATYEELRFAIETRRALAKHNARYEDIQWFIPAEHLPKSGNQGMEIRAKFGAILFNQPNKKGLRPDDIVGAKLKDGREVWFEAPIKRFVKAAKEPTQPPQEGV